VRVAAAANEERLAKALLLLFREHNKLLALIHFAILKELESAPGTHLQHIC
jgi:hypothetical protein